MSSCDAPTFWYYHPTTLAQPLLVTYALRRNRLGIHTHGIHAAVHDSSLEAR